MTTFAKNITALYLIKISKWFTLVMPVIVLFYTECGLSVADVFVLKSAYSVAMMALDIPAGYLADVWGRRGCLVIGCAACFAGSLCYTVADTFTPFLVAEILHRVRLANPRIPDHRLLRRQQGVGEAEIS